ncbi:RmlC-like cupin domain-containing protein [Baffinella frigidus]|nr:RmlC-like cupin domain-containing protein [Cryptophyta sp. CCMP2293]|mmetsp:Transcript_48348/g.115054  ORF Transcript_48348/g.115054 Transcript_48348/m.115054 type:complete len:272 (+) Transcript_48348:206-1021(+)
MSSFKKVADSTLFVSEPNPSWFGNSPNEELPTWTNGNWLKSRFHFSFAEYKGSKNDNFGCLRVMNDDLVQPARGFGKHPHREMEIVTYIVEGSLTHQDSIGTKETLGKGSIQFMTAGTGVSHSEHNLDPKNPLRFIQMWIVPKERGLSPNYGGMHGSEVEKDRQDKWAHIVSDVKHPGPVPVKINQDCNMWVTELGAGKTLDLELKSGRQAYLLQVEGSSDVKGEEVQEAMARHDAGEIIGPAKLSFTAGSEGAHMLYVEMAGKGSDSRFR